MRSFLAVVTILVLPTVALSLSVIPSAPLPERISRAQVIVVGRYVYYGLPGMPDSVAVEEILIDRRLASSRNKVPTHRLEYLANHRPRGQTGYTGKMFLFWFKDRKGLEFGGNGGANLPVTIEDCDRLLDQLSDSLTNTRNPNFGAMARYLIAQRDHLPLGRQHNARGGLVVPGNP